jgi:transcription initiation factor TFIID subunit 1, fungi type
VSLSLDDRSFDLVLLANWEDQIVFEPDNEHGNAPPIPGHTNLTTPLNKALESGAWTQSIIWSPRAPFRDFTQLELNEEDVAQDERQTGIDRQSPDIMVSLMGFSSGPEAEETISNR